jgi:indolepyruvate ferredoxin oxidoreductase, beta subunit
MKKLDVFIAGVGGQGSLTASMWLGTAAMRAGLPVVVGEIHGMAQRGGIVTSTVRIGTSYGPIISAGKADVVLGFEPVETWRGMPIASPDTLVISNTRPMVPAIVSMKGDRYPASEEVVAELKKISHWVVPLDATGIAAEAGNALASNSVLLGVLAGTGALPFDSDLLLDLILESVPSKAVDVNRDAYRRGFELGREAA